MFESVRLFQDSQDFKTMAVSPSGPNQTQCIFWKQVVFVGLMILYGIASLAFFLLEANSATEYGGSLYMFSTELTTTIFYFSFVLKIGNIMAYIDEFNTFYHESKAVNQFIL